MARMQKNASIILIIRKIMKISNGMSLELEKIKSIIVPILKQNGVEFAGVFGSVARGDDKPDSDVDILIRTGPKSPTGFAFFGIQEELEKALGREVDILTEKYVHPYIRKYVLRDLIDLYGERRFSLHQAYPGRYHFN